MFKKEIKYVIFFINVLFEIIRKFENLKGIFLG